MSQKAFREAMKKLAERPHDPAIYEEISNLYDQPIGHTISHASIGQVMGEVTNGTYNFAIALTVLPQRPLEIIVAIAHETCLSASLYEDCLKNNKKLTQEQIARFSSFGYFKKTATPFVPSASVQFIPPPKDEKESSHDSIKQGLADQSQSKAENYIYNIDVATLAEFLATEENMSWVLALPLWSSNLILKKAQDRYDHRHDALAKQHGEAWRKKIAEAQCKQTLDSAIPTLKKETLAVLPPSRPNTHSRDVLAQSKIAWVLNGNSVEDDAFQAMVDNISPGKLALFLENTEQDKNEDNFSRVLRLLPLSQVHMLLMKSKLSYSNAPIRVSHQYLASTPLETTSQSKQSLVSSDVVDRLTELKRAVDESSEDSSTPMTHSEKWEKMIEARNSDKPMSREKLIKLKCAILDCLPHDTKSAQKRLRDRLTEDFAEEGIEFSSDSSDIKKNKHSKIRDYFTSGQFWMGLLFAIGLVLMCMPFAAPVVFPVLGLAAFLSTSIGTIALEAGIAFVGGFIASQMLWKFADIFSLALRLQKLGQWMEKWAKAFIHHVWAGISKGVTFVLHLMQVGFSSLFDLGIEYALTGYFFIAIPGAIIGFCGLVGTTLAVLAITIPLGLSALVLTGVGLILEALGWIFAALPMRAIGSIEGDSFIASTAKWVLYLIAFPFFQVQKMGKFMAETAFAACMSLYSDAVVYGTDTIAGYVKGAPFEFPFLEEDDYFNRGETALTASASVHAPVSLAELPKAASVACGDSHWMAEKIEDLVASSSSSPRVN